MEEVHASIGLSAALGGGGGRLGGGHAGVNGDSGSDDLGDKVEKEVAGEQRMEKRGLEAV